MYLSKSDYILYLKQPAWLWLKKNDKDVLPPPDDNLQATLDAGNLFESYAEQRFPDGLRLGFEDYDEYAELTEATKQVLEEDIQTIFQGRFEAGDLTCIVDVLDRVGGNTFDLYEIKASSSAKTDHVYDLAFQVTVIEATGYNIRNVSVIHVDSSYVREGDIDYQKFTKLTDITKKVRAKMDFTQTESAKAVEVMHAEEIPDISPRYAGMGGTKEWLGIFRTLKSDIPPYSIYDLCSVSAKAIGDLEDEGITLITDIPASFKLTPKQSLQAKVTRDGEPLLVPTSIKNFLGSLTYPLYFLDYETFASTVPYFDGTKPYKQIPFQYSLHILDTPDGELRHKEYLHRENSNAAEPLSKQLQEDIGTEGSVITWNMSFEAGCNKLMGELLPEYTEFYEQLNARIVDLMLPFAKSWYVDKNFYGSASIKNVLPVLVPELSYKTLGIQEGLGAQRLWMEAILDGKRADEKEKILSDLIEYCGLDTLAMVEIYRKLKNI